MTAAGLLSSRRVLVPLEARTLAEAVQNLVAACAADGLVADTARLQSVIAEASPEDTLTVGADFFLPHFRTDAVSSVVVALGMAALAACEAGPGAGGRIGTFQVWPGGVRVAFNRMGHDEAWPSPFSV